MLNDDTLNVRSENQAWTAIKRWCYSDLVNRQQSLPELLLTMRTARMDISCLTENILTDPMVCHNSQVLEQVNEIILERGKLAEKARGEPLCHLL